MTQAQSLADGLNRDFPSDTLVQQYSIPCIRAAIALEMKEGARAIEVLQVALPVELGRPLTAITNPILPAYLRGQAYLQLRQADKAVAEFNKLFDRSGVVLNMTPASLARLGLGRAYALQGNTAQARAAYLEFFNLWKDADADIPVLKQAKSEFAQLR